MSQFRTGVYKLAAAKVEAFYDLRKPDREQRLEMLLKRQNYIYPEDIMVSS